MEKILIALDYSSNAQQVAVTGHKLARGLNAQVILLHVISEATYYSPSNYSPIMGFEGFPTVVEPNSTQELKNVAQLYLDKTTKHLDDETIQTIVKTGVFPEVILSTAKELDVDIIVMGTHSRRGLEKILLGSVAENVLHHSTIPLFIIPVKEID